MSDPGFLATPRPGPYFAVWGPASGPILGQDQPPAIGVHPAPDNHWPIGMALPVGLVEHRRGPATTFRLIIGGFELEGRWICMDRRFVLLGDVAEPLP